MEKLLNQLGLGTRIIALSLIPLLISLLFATSSAYDARKLAEEATDINTLAVYAPIISSVVHELQKERGRTAGYIGSGGAGRAELEEQRKSTEQAIRLLQEENSKFNYVSFDQSFANIVQNYQTALSRLDATRKSVNDQDITVAQMASYYSSTIAKLLDTIKSMVQMSNDADISRRITAYVNLLEAKERAGQERAMGNSGYASGQFSPAIYKRFVELVAVQNAFIGNFNEYASKESAAYYERTLKGPAVSKVQAMRDHTFSTQGNVGTDTYDSRDWFNQITTKINLLKQVEDHVNNEILTSTESLMADASSTFWFLTISLIIGTIVLLGFTFAVFRSVATPLETLESTMESLSTGNLETHVPYIDYGSSIG
ncbi:MAG: nitrate- and nitrite sensing domain-containing protein, partial [Kordiimonas sp.]